MKLELKKSRRSLNNYKYEIKYEMDLEHIKSYLNKSDFFFNISKTYDPSYRVNKIKKILNEI
jgi:hypothetical protein